MKHRLIKIHFLGASLVFGAFLSIGCAEGVGEPTHIVRSRDAGPLDSQTVGSDQNTMDAMAGDPATDGGSSSIDGASQGPDATNSGNYLREIPDSLAPAFGDSICGYLERCEFKALLEAIINEPCTRFLSRQFRDGTVERLRSAVAAGTIGFDPIGAQQCLAAFEALECSPDFEALAMTCLSSFVGQIRDGEECEHQESCRLGLYCDTNTECPGTCAPKSAPGEPCSDPLACTAGATCVQGTCQLPVAQGQTCGGNGPTCEAGLYCDGENGGSGRCRVFNSQLVGEGSRCEINGGPLCEAGLACITEVNVIMIEFRCRARVGEGEVCHPGLPDHCADGLYCGGTNISTFPPDLDGRCVVLPGEGERCGSAPAFEVCGPELICDGGRCQPRSALEDPCSDDARCYSGQCADGICVAHGLCGP
jgi:hypothetical protein